MLENNVRSIAFCAISTGIFGYPVEQATHTALRVVRKWLESNDNASKVRYLSLLTAFTLLMFFA